MMDPNKAPGARIDRLKRRENPKRAERVLLAGLAVAVVVFLIIRIAPQALGKTAHTVLQAEAPAAAFQEGW